MKFIDNCFECNGKTINCSNYSGFFGKCMYRAVAESDWKKYKEGRIKEVMFYNMLLSYLETRDEK